ncbi:hypothetical protein [Staphylococcus equorum]|uniref:hypothetical protein n=1 Tax=Staphylococcus equorum TaxID=246432 RepID=UPI003FD75163
MDIKSMVNELLEQFELTYEKAKEEYDRYKRVDFEKFEDTKTYYAFDRIYEILGYDYLLYDELAKSEVSSTSDLIDFMLEDEKEVLTRLLIDLIEDNIMHDDKELKQSLNNTIRRFQQALGITNQDIKNYYKNVLHMTE